MILSSECLSAHITGKWSFVGVGSFMDQKIVGFSKLTVTKLTDKPFLRSGCSRIQTVQVLGSVQPMPEEQGRGEVR